MNNISKLQNTPLVCYKMSVRRLNLQGTFDTCSHDYFSITGHQVSFE